MCVQAAGAVMSWCDVMQLVWSGCCWLLVVSDFEHAFPLVEIEVNVIHNGVSQE